MKFVAHGDFVNGARYDNPLSLKSHDQYIIVLKHCCSSNIGQHEHKVIWPLLKRKEVAIKQKGGFSMWLYGLARIMVI